jgi:hypothetical protein
MAIGKRESRRDPLDTVSRVMMAIAAEHAFRHIHFAPPGAILSLDTPHG